MKKCILLTMATLLLFSLTACEDLLDVEERFSFTERYIVDTSQSSFDQTANMDLAANVDLIDEYGDKIKDVQVEKVEFWLEAFSGGEQQRFLSGSLSVAEDDGSDMKNIATLGEYTLQDLLNTPHELTPSSAGIEKLGTLAEESPHRFQLIMDADFNEGPLDFTVVVKVTAMMVANPLN